MPVRALARVNLAAIERNVEVLRSALAAPTALCAVVKADGYGHGAVPCARAALSGGATWLATATAAEALALREGGLDGPILVMGAISDDELPVALAARADVVAWTEEFVDRLRGANADWAVGVHVKLDTGMGRLGTRDESEAMRVAALAATARGLRLAGAMTHFATADDDLEFVTAQLKRFAPFVAAMRDRYPEIIVHAANSAAAMRAPASHYDLVRCGIAIYGCDPSGDDPVAAGLEPALELSSYVAAVKPARRGESAGYGRQFVADGDTSLATIPIGYGDGIRRALSNNCDVLIAGRRYPLVGTVSMDNITVDLGPGTDVRPGERVVLIGHDGDERQTAEALARRIGTINYEVTCGITARVPRSYHRDGEPVR